MKKQLNKTEKEINNLVDCFVNKYFDGDEEFYWVDYTGGTLSVSDMFFSFDDILETARYNPSYEQLSSWYYYHVDCSYVKDSLRFSLRNWLKLKKYPKKPLLDKNIETYI